MDRLQRRMMSRAFGAVYKALHRVRLTDPSCPYVVASRQAAQTIASAPPELPQGYWWEFHARGKQLGFTTFEVPVSHRVRIEGGTRVYKWLELPRIGVVHLQGLWRLRKVSKG